MVGTLEEVIVDERDVTRLLIAVSDPNPHNPTELALLVTAITPTLDISLRLTALQKNEQSACCRVLQ